MPTLDGKIVFVAGGAGNIGGNIVRGCLRAGATVVTASRDPERFERLHRFIADSGLDASERLFTLVGDVSDEAGVDLLRAEMLQRVGSPDSVIASLGGGMRPQTLLGMPLETWNSVLQNNLTSHFLTARAFLPPLIQRGTGTYLLISGYGGESIWVESAPISVAAGGVINLGRNLAAENKDTGVRIKPMVLVTSPALWSKFEGTPGAYRGDDVGDFMAWLASDEGAEASAEVIHYVTDWNKANVIRHA